MPFRYKGSKFPGRQAGALAMPVWVCSLCEAHYKAVIIDGRKTRPVDQCKACGSLAFDFFASSGEAKRWAELRLEEKLGSITKLRRQVKYPLMAIGPQGFQVHVADYNADYVYVRDGREIVEDHKGKGGMDREAKLKLKWMHAQLGHPVLIHET